MIQPFCRIKQHGYLCFRSYICDSNTFIMRTILRSASVLLLALMPVLAAAQDGKLFRDIRVVTEFEINDGAARYSVFNMPTEGQNHYYLTAGKMGLGNEVVQVQVDPLSELYIPLGGTLNEAMAVLEEMKGLLKKDVGASMVTEGCLTPVYPSEDNIETVTVTHARPILAHQLEFKIDRERYLLITYINKSDFNSIVSGVKFYRKLHPKEE